MTEFGVYKERELFLACVLAWAQPPEVWGQPQVRGMEEQLLHCRVNPSHLFVVWIHSRTEVVSWLGGGTINQLSTTTTATTSDMLTHINLLLVTDC